MIYMAAPYTNPDAAVREQRFQAACRVAAALIEAGEVVFSPLSHSVPIAKFGLPSSWAFWRGQDTAFLERCDELVVLMLDGWEESVGVHGEIQIARELGKPIRYLRPADVSDSRTNAQDAPDSPQHSANGVRFLPGRN